jgi:hypothetical protein
LPRPGGVSTGPRGGDELQLRAWERRRKGGGRILVEVGTAKGDGTIRGTRGARLLARLARLAARARVQSNPIFDGFKPHDGH